MCYRDDGKRIADIQKSIGAAPGGQVWISEQTYGQVKGEFKFEALEPQYFKGKKEAVAVYQVEPNITDAP